MLFWRAAGSEQLLFPGGVLGSTGVYPNGTLHIKVGMWPVLRAGDRQSTADPRADDRVQIKTTDRTESRAIC